MTNNYNLVSFHLNGMVEMLMNNYAISYEEALPKAMSSDTYKLLLDKPFLQEEGLLFIQELLNKELSSKKTGQRESVYL